ncbi:MAG: V-type sodium ATP synthase subunit K (Na(+)-translocating ATPase subunit K) [Thermotoga sp. 50_1627]|uniref:V-type ATP synthase subunit K n=1 Tax=Pseudothermotoga sp. TaxID=2033661 RepID=UPI00076D01D8|nr:MAG: V-type sodium ATP synthase subunit K (Na(+)-translocating ATPase subunit K) [Thermotoga sp. 50_64]KUK25832.1 MAG: V-type sodium ATP synthase subunit K (Na(+)-translocating ATPase subunit K) [Thermotoga sp. 50_1627]MBC7115517.1 V-type ATP synthase subunit K [Pseudothermotoga sp.]MDK2923987.1 V/A-type H+/Na+-transporting ATPase subunit [Pseudothermotoga sp.]HBT40065.1 V-type ATP synthase subunit K [Pseudothermotoga sp.]
MLGLSIALIGAALGAAFGAIGSAKGVGMAGEAAAGVLAEKPELFGTVLILQALPGTQGFYGFIGAFLILLRLGVLGGNFPELTLAQGLTVFAVSIPLIFGLFVSGIWQGKASVAALQMVAQRPQTTGQAIIIPALVETYAILSLITSIILLFYGVKL